MALLHEEITRRIIRGALRVHRELGPGLLESAYEEFLVHELTLEGLHVERQVAVAVVYRGRRIKCGYRMDLLVEGVVVVELKSVEKLTATHEAQLMTYLRLADMQVGLVINFNVTRLVDGIMRRVITPSPN